MQRRRSSPWPLWCRGCSRICRRSASRPRGAPGGGGAPRGAGGCGSQSPRSLSATPAAPPACTTFCAHLGGRMSRFSFRYSLVAAVVVLAGAPGRAPAAIVPYADDAQAALTNGMRLLRRALHLGQDEVVSHAISLSSREAALELELAGGRTRTVA